jgi:ABC-2 type transport system ATP-binding protein
MPSAVSVKDLTRRFGDFTAVDRVSFDVAAGEIFGFLGPNGAGKTTTIKMLNGLLRPTSGTASVAGFDVVKDADDVRCNIGYMSQLFSLYADLTVAENIALFAGLYGITGSRYRRRCEWVLDMADLEDHQTRLTGELPLGWKQRLALGCAILHEPPILFLDEPTSGVDPVARRNFWDLINGLSADGTTVFVSTHYMEEAEYSHRLALLTRGRLIALDTPASLRAGMTDPILQIETDDAPKAADTLKRAPGVIEASMFGRDVHVVVESEADAHRDIPAILARSGNTCENIHPVSPSLEDVFVAHVRREGGAVLG